ncbi:MAG: transcriptional repressor LexA [Eubacteriales bacterium]|nr:transcriptional repressor LexA [Eubacteriales bacterium]
MRPITEKQKQILHFIRECTAEQGYPPSVREIAAAVGLRSPSSVHAHLKRLRDLGYLEQEEGKTRTIKVAGHTGGAEVPLLGRVAAGMPILAVEQAERLLHVDLDGDGKNHFALRIRGDSMVEAGILDGDFIIVRSQNHAQEGQIVVAMLEDEATCKRLEQDEDGHVWLMPENPNYDPIPGDYAHIIGVVVKVIRDYPV